METGTVLVTGGTGTLGRAVVPRLLAAGADVRVLSRRRQPGREDVRHMVGDLASGAGVEDAVRGADVVVHCAGSATGDEAKARTLVRAASDAGVRHLVNISVVGADRIPVRSRLDRMMFGYYASQVAAEQVIAQSGIGWTTLRATQFHDLILAMARAMVRLPVVPVPAGWRFQPVDSGEVAARLVELALSPPAGRVPDVGGPRVHPMRDLVGGYLRAVGRPRPIVPIALPGGAARAFRDGANLAPERAVGRRTWEDFLAERR